MKKRPVVILGICLLAVLLAGLTAILIGTLARPGHDDRREATGPVTVTGPVDGLHDAVLEVRDGATSLHITAGALDDDLYRITTPDGSGLDPRVDRHDGDVRLGLTSRGDGGSGLAEIVLNSGVSWTLRTDGGTQDTRIDMTGGSVTEVRFAGGASRIDLTLPKPARAVPVTMTGGVDQFRVRLATGTPVRVTASNGAGQVTIGDDVHQGVGGGQSFTANGWTDGAAGVDVRCQAGAGGVTIDFQ